MKRTKWIIAAGLVLLACAACLPPSPVSSSPDSFSATAGLPRGRTLTVTSDYGDSPSLESAMQWWNGLAGRQLFAYGPGPIAVQHVDTAAVCDQPVAVVGCTAGLARDGYYHWPPTYPYVGCVVSILAGWDDWRTTAHELGHCLGFQHVSDRPSIMAGDGYPDPGNPGGDAAMLHAAGY